MMLKSKFDILLCNKRNDVIINHQNISTAVVAIDDGTLFC
jgi:hypothetical protein